ncbi:Panacea domain-containing protein [Streptomyces sp. NPDC046984]|uniref:Panacea domain-containing protein n=1 Tax=Streptomyces sp. NPDC046984 TaxID=3155138 RepID=UPI003406367C
MDIEQPYELSGAPAAVAALLLAARAKGVVVGRTKIAKLLYLADLKAVKEMGRPCSGITWKWLDHGPFAYSLYRVENDLIAAGVIQRDLVERDFGGAEYRFRYVGHEGTLDIDTKFAEIVGQIVQEYGHLAASTLRDLSYQTEPMQEAQEGGKRGVVLDLFGRQPVPPIGGLVAKMQARLKRLGEQQDEGDPRAMVDEIEEWGPGRARANGAFGN